MEGKGTVPSNYTEQQAEQTAVGAWGAGRTGTGPPNPFPRAPQADQYQN